jgi:cellulose synthase/poly-beta-1,6-N-acetylglucosamine synthase-like glycosyltransferase
MFSMKQKIKKFPGSLPILHDKPSTLKMAFSRTAIVLTILFWIIYIISTIFRQFIDGKVNYQFTLEAFWYAAVVSIFTFSALIYLITRQGAFERFSRHVRVPRFLLDKHFSTNQPTITVLIPSYAEEVDVIRKTMMSAALQEYPHIRVVLLIDDNPNPTNQVVAAKLNATRNLPSEIYAFLSKPYTTSFQSYKRFQSQQKNNMTVSFKEVKLLAKLYAEMADWLYKAADQEIITDHVDHFFADQVFRGLANDLQLNADALDISVKEQAVLSVERVDQLYRRLISIFKAEVTTFERKKYLSLSHEANKAMNLNSYIGLMGGNYLQQQTETGTILMPINHLTNLKKISSQSILNIPDSDFILTLDADSVLLREYCLRLTYFLQQPDNQKVAVIQTPYSSFQGATSPVERLSGATTDIQHVLHQGMSYYNAAFWVGANAVIRKEALADIVETEWVGGFEVKRYIQDRTVIEDTESSIDLATHGWKLVNYPERLSYSATPPDFGSLVVQRRRWANGGLLIIPKLWKYIFHQKHMRVSKAEILIRLNYMASIAWSSFGLLFMLAYPYDGRLLSPFVFLAALPYYIAMTIDLKYCGYKYSDIFRIYGFNLILLPVNLAGVFKSLEQYLTGKKIPFARTPKIRNRTSVALTFIISPILIVSFSVFTLYRNILEGNWVNASVAAFNALAATWAIVAYIGVFNLLVDMWVGLTDWLYVESKVKNVQPSIEEKPDLNWRAVLYSGEAESIVPHHVLNDLSARVSYRVERQTS